VKNEERGGKHVGFVGGGNMTLAIAGGLLNGGFPAARLHISESRAEQRARLRAALHGVAVDADNAALVADIDCLVLATKPQVLGDVCSGLRDAVQARRPLIISIAAGVRSHTIASWLGGGLAVIRVMPNQPAVLGLGASALFANQQASDEDRDLAATIVSAVGDLVWVRDEADIDTVTAISGSGPAYFYLLIDMLIESTTTLGLEAAAARALAVQTALGASALAADSDAGMEELIARVRSPGGTTAAALDSLEQQGVRAIFATALRAARDRAVFLADEVEQ
jgi:pyrroline-5-carboxylate reductase